MRRLVLLLLTGVLVLLLTWPVRTTTQPIDGVMWIPSMDSLITTVATSTLQLNAESEIVALVTRMPRSCTLDRFEAYLGAEANTPDNGLRFSFQDVSATDGLPDGVVDQFATIASGSVAVGWSNPGNFDTTRSVTRGDLIALVIDNPSFTAGDDVSIQHYVPVLTSVFPYTVHTTNTKANNIFPTLALHCTDGYVYLGESVLPIVTSTSASVNTGTTPDEVGTAFQLPFPCTLSHVRFQVTPGANADLSIVVYENDGDTASTTTHDGSIVTGASALLMTVPLTTAVAVPRDTEYKVAVLPTTATSSTLRWITLPELAYFGGLAGGSEFYMVSRTNAGSWTSHNNVTDEWRRFGMQLGFSSCDDGASGVRRVIGG